MNAFDKVAKKATDSTRSEVIAATINKTVANDIDTFVSIKQDIKTAEADLKIVEVRVIEHLRAQQDALAYGGNFTKSLRAQGIVNSITYVTSDKFSVPQDEDSLKALKKVAGDMYDDLFETKRNISIKKEVLDNDTLVNKIATACEKAGLSIGEIFDVGDKVVAKSGLDKKQYDLPKSKLEVFRTLVKQNKPALK
jgi:molybdopterin converting factor small subunit